MKLHRFYTSEAIGDMITIVIASPELVNQLKSVFRLKTGDSVILFDGSGFDYVSKIDSYSKLAVSFTILEKKENAVRPELETYLFASLIKKDNFEWIAQKATELGVSHIIPIISQRTEKKDINVERLQKIIIEAAEQSGRGTIPKLYDVVDLETALIQYGEIKSIAWEPTAEKFSQSEISDCLGSYIGPEGGWTTDELDLFKKHGIVTRSLGPQILRAETAVIAVISRLVF